jgi:hypothetical protein
MTKDCLRCQSLDGMMILKQVFGMVTALYQFTIDLLTGLYGEGSINQQIS